MLSVDLSRRQFSMLPAAAFAAPATTVLVHEHVLVNFLRASYDPDAVFAKVKPKLDAVARLGCKRFQDCTPNFIGRDAKLLRRLQDATGIEIWTNTGLYAARNHEYLPPYAKQESPEQLARRWVAEWRNGVDGVKPRFIKIGVNRGPLGELDRKIVKAAALCARETGLTIASHTGNGVAAMEQIAIVAETKTPIGKFVWVHADGEKDHGFHKKAAEAGAWVEFDHIGPAKAALDWHLECVRFMDAGNLLRRTLISQDAGYYKPGEPDGGSFKDYDHLYTKFAPLLSPSQHKTLLQENPYAAFGK
ncbi:MAG: hypothetical protein JNK48_28860 [Bryobacterales bacterium]|nr:hypothetical protein [Bryobacterales bacterium]